MLHIARHAIHVEWFVTAFVWNDIQRQHEPYVVPFPHDLLEIPDIFAVRLDRPEKQRSKIKSQEYESRKGFPP